MIVLYDGLNFDLYEIQTDFCI